MARDGRSGMARDGSAPCSPVPRRANHSAMVTFLEALASGPLVVDGAMGTQLYERGVLFSVCFEELNITKPELVRKVHEDYVRAGATVIETNTFGANSMRLEKHGLVSRMAEINHAAVKVAREAAGAKAFVVGAIGPSGYFLGEALPQDLDKVRTAISEQAKALVASGVDGTASSRPVIRPLCTSANGSGRGLNPFCL